MHLGKTGYFRLKGVPIPSSVMKSDLERLSELINLYRPEKIIVAGDMFHHQYNTDIHYFGQWRKNHETVRFILVPGNHDRLLDIDYRELGICLAEEVYNFDPFTVIHQPVENNKDRFIISGHVHPGYVMEGRARQSLYLPCFIVSPYQIILPAFSAFTGLYTGYPVLDTNHYYLIGDNSIFSV